MDENMFDLGLDVATISAELPDPVITLSGADSYTVQGTADYPLLALSVYGKSVQNGTPTPEAPIDIVSVGDDGAVEVVACGKNLANAQLSIYFNASSYKLDTNSLSVTSNTGYGCAGATLFTNLIVGKKYTLSLKATGFEYDFADGYVIVFNKTLNTNTGANLDTMWDNQYIIWTAPSGKQQITFTAKTNTVGITLLRSRGGSNTETVTISATDIQLEEGTATEFEQYKGNTAFITSGLPLCSVGDVRDELIYNADGTGKIIKRTAKKRLVADGTLHHNGEWQAGGWGINDFFTNGVEISSFVAVANYYCNYATFNTGAHYIVSTAGLIGVAQGGCKNLYFRFSAEHTTSEAVTNYLNANEVYIVYELASPKEIELSAAEMAELQKLQSYEGTTSIYNNEQAEMLVKMLRSDYDMKYIEWLKESQTWTCPKAGKWKVICVGGGASGGLYNSTENAVKLTPTTAGGTTSFGSIVSADGAPSTKDSTVHGRSLIGSAASGYGGYTGTSFGGVPMIGGSVTSEMAAGGSGNAAVMAFANPTAAVGYGAGGGAVSLDEKISVIAGRAGAIESTIVDLDEGQTIMCTVGKGGQTTDATVMGSGADGVIVVQYLGY